MLKSSVVAVLKGQERLERAEANNSESLARIARAAGHFPGYLPQRQLAVGELRPAR